MSIKTKFESIKKEVSKDRAASDIAETKKSVVELVDRKTVLENKISNTQSILSELERIFSESEKSLTDFKTQKEQLTNLFSEYKDYLAEKDINSVQDLLDNPEFADEEEIKQYNEVRPGKDSEGNRGRLGRKVEDISEIKDIAKRDLSDLDLDFRGGTKEGEEISPRKQSFGKIKNYIEQLKADLEKLTDKEEELKVEYLPRINDLLEENIDKMMMGENFNPGKMFEDINFIKDEVFELCGDELWPEVKKTASELIAKKYKEKWNQDLYQRYYSGNMDTSLEMEKLIFDANDIRENHKELLALNHDRDAFKNFANANDYFYGRDDKTIIKNNKAYPSHILSQVEYFNEKNIEAKTVCESLINEAKEMVKEAQEKIPSTFLSGSKERMDISSASEQLKTMEQNLTELQAPEHFYSGNVYEFYNNFQNIVSKFSTPRNSQKSWTFSLSKLLREKSNVVSGKLQNLLDKENTPLRKLNDDIYQAQTVRRDFEETGGFNVPYVNIAETNLYKVSFNIDDLNKFFQSLEGKELSFEELKAEIEKRKEELTLKIADYPNSKAILGRFNTLVNQYKKDFQSQSLNVDLQKKNYTRNNKRPGYFKETDRYSFQDELFESKI